MTVDQRLMDPGAWGLQLSDSAPKWVRDQITPFSHIVITPAPLEDSTADATILAAARYVGIVRQIGPSYHIGGIGLEGWLGDGQGRGSLIETTTRLIGSNLNSAVTIFCPPALSVGTVISPGGSMVASWALITRRQAFDAMCAYFGVEYRVNPNFSIDVQTSANLYGSTPTIIAMSDKAGQGAAALTAIQANVTWQVDYSDWASKVYVLANGGVGASGGASSYYDGLGNLVTWVMMGQVPASPPTTETNFAASILATVTNPAQLVTVTAQGFDLAGKVKVGAPLYVYEPNIGLVDTANPVAWGSRTIWPKSVRVQAISWPIQRGMGVYLRTRTASAATYLDISPYVQWESGDTRIEVGTAARNIASSATGSVSTPAQLEAAAWDTYTPTVTCNTGANPGLGTGGTANGWFRRQGTLGHLHVTVVIGTTPSNGTGSFYYFSLPSGWTASSTTASKRQYGSGAYLGAAEYVCTVGIVEGDTKVYMVRNSNETLVGPAVPASLASGNQISFSIDLELA